MGRKTSIYLTDSDLKDLSESWLTPSDAMRIGLRAKPRAIDPAEGERTWTTWWFCDPPKKDGKFKAIRDGWHSGPDGEPVREIYEIETSDGQ